MAQQAAKRRDNSSTEACGYITFLLSTLFFILYFLWALLPDSIVKHIDERYTTYYPPRELAGYIPAYLALLFIFVPILYTGLNMLSAPNVDDIDGIWDTRSNTCVTGTGGGECDNNFNVGGGDGERADSLPSICDEDVRLVNLRIRRRLGKEANAT